MKWSNQLDYLGFMGQPVSWEAYTDKYTNAFSKSTYFLTPDDW